MITVNDMYTYANANNVKLLSNYNADFWSDYRTNYARYDKLFKRLYKSFIYFMQEKGESVAEITTNFADDVLSHLMLNTKKYEELYRINELSDASYSLLDNYNVSESLVKNETFNKGARTDSTSSTLGEQSSTNTKEVSPYDTENFYNDSESTQLLSDRTDTGSFTSGAQADTSSENYTLTKKGNIGVMTGSDMLEKHKRFWNMYEFYSYIFGEIAQELLMSNC